jgi:hypothetical protein
LISATGSVISHQQARVADIRNLGRRDLSKKSLETTFLVEEQSGQKSEPEYNGVSKGFHLLETIY